MGEKSDPEHSVSKPPNVADPPSGNPVPAPSPARPLADPESSAPEDDQEPATPEDEPEPQISADQIIIEFWKFKLKAVGPSASRLVKQAFQAAMIVEYIVLILGFFMIMQGPNLFAQICGAIAFAAGLVFAGYILWTRTKNR